MGENAATVFRSIEEQATQDAWFEALGIPRTWLSEHSLIALHVWIIHRRHMLDFHAEGEFCGRQADKLLFEEFWRDTEWRIRSARNSDVSFNRQMDLVQKSTFMDMFEYDAALAVVDDDNMELAGALFRSVFQARPSVDSRVVLLLADWVRAEVWNVFTQPAQDVYRGWITWSPALGETREQRLHRQREQFLGEWREHTWIDGSVYFYNTVTHDRTEDLATLPPQALYGRRRWALTNHLRQLRTAGNLPDAWATELERIEEVEAQREALCGAPGDLLGEGGDEEEEEGATASALPHTATDGSGAAEQTPARAGVAAGTVFPASAPAGEGGDAQVEGAYPTPQGAAADAPPPDAAEQAAKVKGG